MAFSRIYWCWKKTNEILEWISQIESYWQYTLNKVAHLHTVVPPFQRHWLSQLYFKEILVWFICCVNTIFSILFLLLYDIRVKFAKYWLYCVLTGRSAQLKMSLCSIAIFGINLTGSRWILQYHPHPYFFVLDPNHWEKVVSF